MEIFYNFSILLKIVSVCDVLQTCRPFAILICCLHYLIAQVGNILHGNKSLVQKRSIYIGLNLTCSMGIVSPQ